jgi:hypothetical protein
MRETYEERSAHHHQTRENDAYKRLEGKVHYVELAPGYAPTAGYDDRLYISSSEGCSSFRMSSSTQETERREVKSHNAQDPSSEPESAPTPPTQALPDCIWIKGALVEGKKALHEYALKIAKVLNKELGLGGGFQMAFKVLAVKASTLKDGKLEWLAVRDEKDKWGVKTSYDAKLDRYFPAILIYILHKKVRAQYTDAAIGRIINDVYGRDNYPGATLFVFNSGERVEHVICFMDQPREA